MASVGIPRNLPSDSAYAHVPMTTQSCSPEPCLLLRSQVDGCLPTLPLADRGRRCSLHTNKQIPAPAACSRDCNCAAVRPSSSGRLNGQRRRKPQPAQAPPEEVRSAERHRVRDDTDIAREGAARRAARAQDTTSTKSSVSERRRDRVSTMQAAIMADPDASRNGNHIAEAKGQERRQPGTVPVSANGRTAAPNLAQQAPTQPEQRQPPSRLELTAAVANLQERLLAGVRLEEAESKAAGRNLYNRGSERQLKDSGIVLSGLRATKEQRALFGDPVWRFALPAKSELPFHRFTKGDAVILSAKLSDGAAAQLQQEGDLVTFEAIVLEVKRSYVSVVVDVEHADTLDDIGAATLRWRMDQTLSSTTTKREISAVEALSDMQLDHAALRARLAIIGNVQLALAPNTWARDDAWRKAMWAALSTCPDVNRSQQKAVLAAAFSTLTLWQGPPGTGKTRALLALMKTLASVNQRSNYARSFGTILACAGTNAAADNLAEGLVAAGVRTVRVGQPAKVRAGLQAVTLDALTERTARGRDAAKQLSVALEVIDFATRVLAKPNLSQRGSHAQHSAASPVSSVQRVLSRADMTHADAKQTLQQGRRQRDCARKLFREAYGEVLDKAQVIVATCAGAGGSELKDRSYRMVVIDEATQATEPSTLIPLVKGAECVVLAGDPLQLPPTVLSRRAGTEFGLTTTLFERLQGHGVKPLLLDTQYRMHQGIADFPSRTFYGSFLQTGVPASERPPPTGYPWPVPGLPVALVPCEDGNEETADAASDLHSASTGGKSFRNTAEATQAIRAMSLLLDRGDVGSAAILTPYNGQLRLLRQLIRSAGSALANVEVATVDGFQGREADVVVFSAVRCNDAGSVGFLSDPRRLNVAFTRPRRGLVVVASPRTLMHDTTWRSWVQWARDIGAVSAPLLDKPLQSQAAATN